jgi:L-threonylcarbamoyladenylate synthase
VAFPTETVYGLGADATNEKAVARIYEVKGRPTDHPLIVHISSMEHIDKWASEVPEYAIKLARAFWPGPMTLVLKRTDLAKDFITGSQETVAIRVPSHTLGNQFLKEFESLGGYGVVAPSANRFGKVSPTSASHVKAELAKGLHEKDLILDGGLSDIGIESTIIICTNIQPKILRLGTVTGKKLSSVLGIPVEIEAQESENQIKAPGSFTSHYSPNAEVFLSGSPKPGDGFIALSTISTPEGAIRLASPENNNEYASVLYQALHLADSKHLSAVFVVPPSGDEVALAICDRLVKSANKDRRKIYKDLMVE